MGSPVVSTALASHIHPRMYRQPRRISARHVAVASTARHRCTLGRRAYVRSREARRVTNRWVPTLPDTSPGDRSAGRAWLPATLLLALALIWFATVMW